MLAGDGKLARSAGNLSADSRYADIRATLADRLEDLRGLSIKPLYQIITDGRVGASYELPLEAWGGEASLQWTLDSGELPTGLSLDPATGVMRGSSCGWLMGPPAAGADGSALPGRPGHR